jgi:hypothetical protein
VLLEGAAQGRCAVEARLGYQRQFLVAARGRHSVLTLFILVKMAGISPLDLSASCVPLCDFACNHQESTK